MNRYFSVLGWLALGLIAVVAVNLIFFCFVVGLDIAFGQAPEFTVPIFVPVLICIVCGTAFLLKRSRTNSRVEADFERPVSTDQTVGLDTRLQRSLLRTVLVIRRQSGSRAHFERRKMGTYETS